MASTYFHKRIRILVPTALLAIVGVLVAGIFLTGPRKPPAMLGASTSVEGGLARIQGVIPTEVDGWTPAAAPASFAEKPAAGLHRVRILLEFTAMEQEGLSFDSSSYRISSLGAGEWKAVWSTASQATARQGESIDAVLVFELPDRAIDLTLELPGGPGLALGAGHHKG